MKRGRTRRQFLSQLLGGSAAVLVSGRRSSLLAQGSVAGGSPSAGSGQGPKTGAAARRARQVVRVTSGKVVDSYGRIDRGALTDQVGRACMTIVGEYKFKDVMPKLLDPEDRVGLVVNRAWGLGTSPDLVEFFYGWVVGVGGLPENNVAIWRGQPSDYDQDGLARSFLDWSTVIFTLPSLYAHWRLGMVGALANILSLVRDPEPYYQSQGRGLGRLWTNPTFRQKHRLVVMDALWPYLGSAPNYDPELRWPQGTVIVSEDPVAVDVLAREVLLARRQLYRGEDWPLEPPADYIEEADTTYGVGYCRREDIHLEDIWE